MSYRKIYWLNESQWQSSQIKNKIAYSEPNYLYRAQIHKRHKVPRWLKKMVDRHPGIFQWGLKNLGWNALSFPFGKSGEDVNAQEAWKYSEGSEGVVVGIIDSGMDMDHPDLKNQLWINEKEDKGVAGVDDDGNGYIDDIHGYDFANQDSDPEDVDGHGTHVAGIIGAIHDNGLGVKGIMPQVRIMVLRFLGDEGTGSTAHALQALDYAVQMGVKLTNNSWGGGGYSRYFEEALVRANEQGLVFVAAAGNDSEDNDQTPHYPSSYQVPNVIAVASMNGKGHVSSFSNWGEQSVHVSAPGSLILSSYKKNFYALLSGTSMASPFVTGLVGLGQAKRELTPEQWRQRLIDRSQVNGHWDGSVVSQGRVDGGKFLFDL